jgi:flagellar biosynthesis protein FlhF
MRQVRLALGPDALIVSNRRVGGGVEILATDPTSVPEAHDDTSAPSARPAAPAQAAPAPAPSSGYARPAYRPAPNDTRQELMSAIGELRGSLENRIDELMWGNQLRRAPQAISLFQALLGFGFSTALLRAMLKRLPENLSAKAAFQWARSELIKHLPVLETEDALWFPGQVIALVGPTGVGKTTTIAKLAARCVKRSGPGSLVLVTTDTYRIGAHEQLKIYGQMLRVPVHVVQDAAELQRVVSSVRPDQTILIDNIGISQRDRYVAEQAAMLASAGRSVNRLLVLNASSHGDTLDEVARNYTNDGGSPLKGCIITKMDEASRPGAVLDTALRYQLRIHYISNGQKVPENLVLPNAQELIDQALAHNQTTRALYAPTEADFAAMMSMAQPASAGSAAQQSGNKQLLPGLLSMLDDTGTAVSADDLSSACALVDEMPALAEAYALWKGAVSADSSAGNAENAIRHLLHVARNEQSQSATPGFLVMHDQCSISDMAGGKGRLRASFVFSAQAQAWVSPLQMCGFSSGWVSSAGVALPGTAGASLLEHPVVWLNQQLDGRSAVHMFDGGSPALWRNLHTSGALWLAQAPGSTRVYTDETPTFVSAVAKRVPHQPVTDYSVMPHMRMLAGLPLNDVVLWFGHTQVQLRSRNQPDLPVRLVSVRVLSRENGQLLKQWAAISSVPETMASAAQLAVWLAVRNEHRQHIRWLPRAWDTMPVENTVAGLSQKALLAAQIGLAAWQLYFSPQAETARLVGASLTGRPGLPPATTVPALLKLFKLKAMMA